MTENGGRAHGETLDGIERAEALEHRVDLHRGHVHRGDADRVDVDAAEDPDTRGQASAASSTPRARRWLWIGAAGFFAWNAWRFRAYLIDDAYISLRYARHLADGHGLVFNLGERVEGYTNFLWTIIGGAAIALGLDGMSAWKLLSAFSTLAILVITPRLLAGDAELSSAARRDPTVSDATVSDPTVPATTWLLGLEAFGYWSTSGMESTGFAALTALAAWLALVEAEEGRRRGSLAVCAALVLFRPEGPLVCALTRLGAWLFLELPDGEKRWRALRRHVTDGLVVAAVLAAHVAWRLDFYGHPLPNTYYAKVTGGSEQWTNGWINLGQWMRSQPVFALALLLPVLLLPAWKRHGRHGRLLALWTMSFGWVLYVVSVGGDFMPFFRFFLPVLPLLAAVTGGLVDLLPRRRLTVAAALLLTQAVTGLLDEQNFRAFVAHRTTVVGQDVGRFFAEELAESALMAVNTAGAVPHEARRPTIDMLGLTDEAIARHPVYVISPLWAGHRRGWGAYVRSRRPEVVIWYNAAGLGEPHYLGDHQLADDPYFRFFYQQKRRRLDAREADRVLARFAGAPFGEPAEQAASNRLHAPELGLSFEVRRRPFVQTLARDAEIGLVYFELRGDAESLWPLLPEASDPQAPADLDRLLTTVQSRWRRELRPGDPEARRQVEALCERARRAVAAGDLEAAKRLLSQAASRNASARSALVYQYVANVATLERDLFLAVQAQREALRLDPDNGLYVRNLRSLLSVPYGSFTSITGRRTEAGP